MGQPITKEILARVVADQVNADPSASATEIALGVLSDPVIDKATTPISRIKSEVYQGAVIPTLAAASVIIAKWCGFEPDVQDVIVVFSAAAVLGGVWTAYGRETTSRPLA